MTQTIPKGGRLAAPSANGCNGTNGHAGDAPAAAPVPVVEAPPPASPPPAPASAPAGGRDEGGRFAKGNRGGPGNPFGRAVAARRKALLDAIAPEDVAALARRLRDQAMGGDVAAAKVLLSYVVGKPAEVADPDRLDLDELRALLERPIRAQLVLHGIEGVDPAAALEFLRDTTERMPVKILGNNDMAHARLLKSLRDKVVEARAAKT